MDRTNENNHYTAFDGQVTFETEPYLTPLVLITIDKIEGSVPSQEFTQIERIFFVDFKEVMSRTISIEFALNDSPLPVIVRLKRFWEKASQQPRNWPEVWQAFLTTYDADLLQREWSNALEGVIPANVAAAPELATPLPEDDEELDNLPEDSPLSGSGKDSTKKRSKPSSQNENPSASATV